MDTKSKFSTPLMVKVAMLGVLAFVIEFLEFALPIFPSFLKLDFSDLIALIGSLALGPVAGLLIELIKNLLHLTVSSTGGVGDLANFVVGSAYVVSAGWYYSKHRTRKGAMCGLLIGIAAIVVAGALVNYFITLPLYGLVLGVSTDMIIGWASAVIPAINSKLTLILYAFCPFNLIKGVVLTLIAIPLYKHISPLLKKEYSKKAI